MGSKAREGAKAMNLAFVLLDFQHAGVRRRNNAAQCYPMFFLPQAVVIKSKKETRRAD